MSPQLRPVVTNECGTDVCEVRLANKIADPSLGPGRINFRGPDEEFGFEGVPKPKFERGSTSPKRKPSMWAVVV